MSSAIWQQEQNQFEAAIKSRFSHSVEFLGEVRNSVAKSAYDGAAGKFKSKLLGGGTGRTISVSHEVRKHKAYVEANNALRHFDKNMVVRDLNLGWNDELIKGWAERRAIQCRVIADTRNNVVYVLMSVVESYGLNWPAHDIFGDDGAVERVKTASWWRKQARVLKARKVDQIARQLRMVHAKGQPYCANETVRLRRDQVSRNRRILENMEALNDEGDIYTLAELSDLSTSNPVNRRNELMVRIRGFEELADQLGHVGVFITTSCPSAYHPVKQIFNKKGKLVRCIENEKYNGSNPREAQDWQCETWKLARAEFAREDIRFYGFRVVEPHHSGTPHWHGLFFIDPERLAEFKSIIKRKWLREDGEERGAWLYRTKVVDIDKSKGSAAGYIAKYIAKNIDGFGVDKDLHGNNAAESAERICAWASCWGIRQFQQIGGPSVIVFRELRRIDECEGHVEEIRKAADSADWAAFCLLMGGPMVKRVDMPLRPARWFETNEETGEFLDCPVTKYGEDSQGKLFGLQCMKTGKFIMSRFYRWSVDRLGEAVKTLLPVYEKTEEELSDEELDFLRGAGGGYGFT